MADEGAKQQGSNQTAGGQTNPVGQTGPLGASGSAPFPKKKRRRRKRKPSSFGQTNSQQTPTSFNLPQVPQQTPQTKKEPEIKIAGLNVEEEKPAGMHAVEEKVPEPAVVTEPKTPEPEPAPTVSETVAPKPESAPEPETTAPSEFKTALKPEEAASAPLGWDQLKQAIKEDHEITKKNLEAGALGVAAAAPVAAAAVKEEVVTETKPVKVKAEEYVKKEKSDFTQEEEQERKEIIRLISKYAIGGCLVIAIIVGLFFFNLPGKAFDAIKNFFMGGGSSTVQQEQVSDEETKIPEGGVTQNSGVESSLLAGENKVTSKEKFEQGVETSIVTGQDIPKVRTPTPAVETVFYIGNKGEQEIIQDRVASYMKVLTRLQNAFKTDIQELLSKSPDREKALEAHISDLNSVQSEAIQTMQQIAERKDEIKVEYNQVSTLKDQLEKDFFNTMDKLEGTDANNILNEFIDVSKRYTTLKAEYSALDKASKLFTTATTNMAARIKDVEFNRSALIKGVQVVDIKGSDLELIIQESQL